MRRNLNDLPAFCCYSRTTFHIHSTQNLRRSVIAVNEALRGTKRVDLFQCARVDPSRPIEEVIRDLQALIKEGLFDHIGMSECSAETLRRANAVYPITAVEIEVSPWSYEEETQKGKAFLEFDHRRWRYAVGLMTCDP